MTISVPTLKQNRSQRSVRRNRRSRADVVWAIVSLFVLQIGFATALNTCLVNLDDGTTFASKSAQFRGQLENADQDSFVIAAFGSSRVMNGFDAAGMESQVSENRGGRTVVYNFGVPGGGNIYTFLSIEKLIQQGVRPDLILVEVYPILLRHGSEQDWFAGNEMRSKSFDNTERYGVKPVSRPWFEEWLFPWHTYRFFVLNRVAPALLPMDLRENWAQKADEHGWVSVDKQPVTETVDLQVAQFQRCIDEFDLSPDTCRAVRDTIALCKQNNIQCKLLWMPEPEGIRNGYRPDVESQITGFFDKLEAEFGVQRIIARDWVDDRGFYDTCHLNREGAVWFTQRLSNQAISNLPMDSIAGSGSFSSATLR